MTIPRRLRGIGFTMLAWAAVWTLAGKGFYPAWYAWLEWANHGTHCWSFFETGGHAWTGWGAFGGLVFALLVAARGRGGGVESLRMGWFAAAGALGGAALPLLTLGLIAVEYAPTSSDLGLALAIGAVLGTGCAAGALAIARRGARTAGA
jgi:hypothetical protein